MQRSLAQFSGTLYDLVIVGAGIHGASAAWDAALRGLSVALIDQDDFGAATSANSLKTVHGGLRYLQDADLGLVRAMIRERKTFFYIAPHLVHPLECIMPTYNRLMKSRAAMSAALRLNDWIGYDRNDLEDPEKHLPDGRIISREACLRLLPGVPDDGLTGAAIWYDGQVYNTERMTLAFVLSAVKAGAHAANYVQAVGLLRDGNRIVGVHAQDALSGEALEIRGRVVLNAAGPWVDCVLGHLGRPNLERRFHHSLAMNVVTGQIFPQFAVGLPTRPSRMNGREASQTLFVAPWRDASLIGTYHAPYAGSIDPFQVRERDVQRFLDQFNTAYPEAGLSLDDVRLVHRGLLPAHTRNGAGRVRLVRAGRVYDHQKDDGVGGLLTLVGVKYTSARLAAEKAVDLVFQKLGKSPPPSRTAFTRLYGGDIENFNDYLGKELRKMPGGVSEEAARRLIYNYGTAYRRVLSYLPGENGAGSPGICPAAPVLKAEVRHAVRHEMAQKLADVVLRRTELGSAGMPPERCLEQCAEIMAAELGWEQNRKQEEIAGTKRAYPTIRSAEVF